MFVKENAYALENCIDPCELLCYKILEILGLGPKIYAFINSKEGLRTVGLTTIKCFIVTEGVAWEDD